MTSIAPMAHTRREGLTTDSWITPKWIIDRFGPFDLDPCACDPQPWPTATRMLTIHDDGLSTGWGGSMVWLNPPYGRQLGTWLDRLARHGRGLALIFARTDTKAFHDHVWPFASRLLFLRGRLTFCRPAGETVDHNSGGPSVLVAYGKLAAARLDDASDLGALTRTMT